MFNQHAKWLKVSQDITWRRPIASLNIPLTSHVWRQDHNGFPHQDPGFIDHVVNKKANIVQVYLPPDANTTVCFTGHCLNRRDRINVIDRVDGLESQGAYLKQHMHDKRIEHQQYITEHGADMPEIRDWCWSASQNNNNEEYHNDNTTR